VNILFDLDGTLMDPREGILACLRHALVGLGYNYPAESELVRYIGPPLQESLRALMDTAGPAEIQTAIRFYRERFSSRGIFENRVYPGIPSMLAALQESGAKLFVATSKPRVFAERITKHFGLAQYFVAVHGSELGGARSTKGELISHILNTEVLSPGSTCMVGDRVHDVIGARENSVLSIGVLWGYGSRDELVAAGATTLCEQPEKLYQIFFPPSRISAERTV
jgi:phosphoglycolate phosphatase